MLDGSSVKQKVQPYTSLEQVLEPTSWQQHAALWQQFTPQALLMDLDNTLLDNNKVFSTYTEKFLNDYFQASQEDADFMRLAICTGRHYATLKETVLPLFRRYYPEHLHVVSGGAAIIKANGEVVWEKSLPSDFVAEIAHGVRERNGGFGFGQGDVFYCDPSTLEERFHAFANVNFQSVDSLQTWQTPLLVISHLNPSVEAFISQFQDQVSIKRMIGYSGRPYFDITMQGVTKASAILQWAELMKMKVQNIAAVGDSANDLEAIVTAGAGFAVANATPEVKAVADGVLRLSNTQNGVAHLIGALSHLGKETKG